MPVISVIVPIYNVSSFISRCAESLLSQTLEDVEFIFVDDCTPDDSIIKLQRVIDRFPNRSVRIVHHEQNKGLPSARNSGLSVASGDYIFHCDGDDWVEPNMLEKMYLTAASTDADLVYCDFFLSYADYERRMGNPTFTNGDALVELGFLGGTMKYNVWNKLVKRSVYTSNNILFPDGHPMGEDMTMILVASNCDIVSYVREALYHYVKSNSEAYTSRISVKSLKDTQYNVKRVEDYLRSHFECRYAVAINHFKLSIKLPFLITDDRSQYEIWKEWYPEANAYAMKNRNLPYRTRLIQWCAAHNMWLILQLYYKVVYKLIYNVMFK